ncbi:2-keto-4-pentenoate hydratase [Thauera sp. Sel9]|uniref:2-keto-4-pentenoate hydratase n=1 Tax=Thauera sp. Sel9 TaxID=2974299 RepID=UPI0021E1481F|nr:fumarylacetoacetate hydrolase family protein [Thauera sp. Sel9]MCV2217961.1 fumarylacetoacetate hydrolase family protein [Thauera sp. Sel9]
MSDISTDIVAAADRLHAAITQGRPIAPLRESFADPSIEHAYAIQAHNTQRALTAGRRLVGRKIGLTSPAVQRQLGVDQPDFGMLFADMAVGDAEPVARGRLIQPKVEAEIAFVLDRPLEFERHTYADVLNAVAYFLPAVEIVDSRIADWRIGLFDTIADNASSGLFVLGGNPVKPGSFDLGRCGIRMLEGERVVSEGNARSCLGNPLNAAIWLADMLVRVGRPLQAGDIVLTGALGPMVAVDPLRPQTFAVDIEGLGHVEASFA